MKKKYVKKYLEYFLLVIMAVIGSLLSRFIIVENTPGFLVAQYCAVVLGLIGFGIGKFIKRRNKWEDF